MGAGSGGNRRPSPTRTPHQTNSDTPFSRLNRLSLLPAVRKASICSRVPSELPIPSSGSGLEPRASFASSGPPASLRQYLDLTCGVLPLLGESPKRPPLACESRASLPRSTSGDQR